MSGEHKIVGGAGPFYYVKWVDKKPTKLIVSDHLKINKENCFEIVPTDLISELEAEREKLATLVARSEYVYQKAIDVQLSMPMQKLIKMEFSDLEDLRQLGAAIEDMGQTIAAITESK